jgi:hypothetical protein
MPNVLALIDQSDLEDRVNVRALSGSETISSCTEIPLLGKDGVSLLLS